MGEKTKNRSENFIKSLEIARAPLFGIFVILVLLIFFSNLHFGFLLILAILFWFLIAFSLSWDYRKSLFVGMLFLATSALFLILDLTSVAERQADLAFFFLLVGTLQSLFGTEES